MEQFCNQYTCSWCTNRTDQTLFAIIIFYIHMLEAMKKLLLAEILRNAVH